MCECLLSLNTKMAKPISMKFWYGSYFYPISFLVMFLQLQPTPKRATPRSTASSYIIPKREQSTMSEAGDGLATRQTRLINFQFSNEVSIRSLQLIVTLLNPFGIVKLTFGVRCDLLSQLNSFCYIISLKSGEFFVIQKQAVSRAGNLQFIINSVKSNEIKSFVL